MSRVHRLVLSLFIVAVSAKPTSYYWAGKNGDSLRTGASPYVAPSDLSAGPTWSYPVPGNGLSRSHPLIDDQFNIYYAIVNYGRAHTGDPRGGIIKFNPDGEMLWNYSAQAAISNGPALSDGLLIFLQDDATVGALNMTTGEELWNVSVGLKAPTDTHSLTAAEGYIIVPVFTDDPPEIPFALPSLLGGENQLVALNMSGHELWRFQSDTYMYNSLSAIVDGSVVVADANGRTYRLDLATGRVLWQHESADYRNSTGFTTGGAIVGPNRVVYVTSNIGEDVMSPDCKGRLSAYALETGQLLWRQAIDEFPANNAAAVGPIGPGGDGPLAVVIVIGQNPDLAIPPLNRPWTNPGSKDGMAVAFDAESGERLAWEHKIHWAHNAAAGDEMWHHCLPDVASNPAIGGDGTVYFGFEDGRIYALRDADGDGLLSDGEVSYYDGQNAYQGSPGMAPGMLVSCSCNSLHVFKASAPANTAPSTELV